MGDPDKLTLQAMLEREGWHIERRPGAHWWQHELWRLTSTWRPLDAVAFLAFVDDPESGKGDIGSVWAISVSQREPEDWAQGDFQIRLSPRQPERLKEIVAATATLRPES